MDMPDGGEEGRPRGELTFEAKSWYNRPHEELVDAFRGFIRQRQQLLDPKGEYLTPQEVVRDKLRLQLSFRQGEAEFFFPILCAYDALAYDHYEAGSLTERLAGAMLSSHYGETGKKTIKLTDPLEIKIVDALADATNLPHVRGQSEIPIPEQLLSHTKWMLSDEYRERVRLARARRKSAA